MVRNSWLRLLPCQRCRHLWISIYSFHFLQVRKQCNVLKGLYSSTFPLLFPGSCYGGSSSESIVANYKVKLVPRKALVLHFLSPSTCLFFATLRNSLRISLQFCKSSCFRITSLRENQTKCLMEEFPLMSFAYCGCDD